MIYRLRLLILAAVIPTLSACATLVGGGSGQGVSISSTPTDASFVIKSSSGIQMASGKTPQTVVLPRKNEYQIEFSVPGYRTQLLPLTKGVNGWVFGNLIFGWIPGLIIDFVTGSANKLEPSLVQVSLERVAAGTDSEKVMGIIRQLDAKGRVISEQKVDLVPVQ